MGGIYKKKRKTRQQKGVIFYRDNIENVFELCKPEREETGPQPWAELKI